MQTRSLSILSPQTASYTTTNAFVNVPQFVITVSEDGNYDITAMCVCNPDGANESTLTRLAINGNPIGGTNLSSNLTAATEIRSSNTTTVFNIALKAADVVSMQAMYVTAANTVMYIANANVGSLQVIKRGI